MKLIIWWCSLMVILPSLSLFWLKKRGRLLFGVIILITALFGYLAPGDLANSMIKTEIEKNKPARQQLGKSLENITDVQFLPTDSDKVRLEKSIIQQHAIIQGLEGELSKEGGDRKKKLSNYQEACDEQLRRMTKGFEKGGERNYRTLLFCGEEFNKELIREEISNKDKKKEVEDFNIIDFGQTENNKLEAINKKLEQICQQDTGGGFPNIGLKNIDKITDSEVKNKLLEIVDPGKNSNLGKFYQNKKLEGSDETQKIEKQIDLSRFSLVATTSAKGPKLSAELLKKVKKIESPLDKYFWGFFIFSLGIEIVIFYIIVKSNKKNEQF